MDPIIVTVDFQCHGESMKSVEVSLDHLPPFDPNCTANSDSKTTQIYQYNGKHDHGSLPELRNNQYESYLVTALLAAKSECDNYLTEVISKNSIAGSRELDSHEEDEAKTSKRKKTDEIA